MSSVKKKPSHHYWSAAAKAKDETQCYSLTELGRTESTRFETEPAFGSDMHIIMTLWFMQAAPSWTLENLRNHMQLCNQSLNNKRVARAIRDLSIVVQLAIDRKWIV